MIFMSNAQDDIVNLKHAHKFMIVENLGVAFTGSFLVMVHFDIPTLSSEVLFSGSKDECQDWLVLHYLNLHKHGFII